MTTEIFKGARVIYVPTEDYTQAGLENRMGFVDSKIYDLIDEGFKFLLVGGRRRKSGNYTYCTVRFDGSVHPQSCWCDNLKIIEVDVGDLEDDF